jgi:glycosyltransferase involved in cell wall biosynthesis
MPLTFSIVTCTWNSAKTLQQTISSVAMQDYPHIEYLFVDGGSTDATLDMIRALDRPFRLIENVGGGISRAMNVGLHAATGDIIAHLHSDDYYLDADVLSRVAGIFDSTQCEWLFGRTMRDRGGKLHAEGYTAPRYSYPALLKRNFIPHPPTFVRRELMLRAGGFDEKLIYAMDYDMWLKLGRLARPVQLDEPLAAFREHAGSLSTRNHIAAMKEDFQVRLAHAGRNPLHRAEHTARYLVRLARAVQDHNKGVNA